MGWDVPPRVVLEEIYDDWNDILRDISFQGLRGVIEKTPVDTGRLRGGWLLTVNQPSEAQSGAVAAALTMQLGDVVYIQNNVEYGVFVDSGPLKYSQFKSGKSAPAMMVDRTAIELQELVNGG